MQPISFIPQQFYQAAAPTADNNPFIQQYKSSTFPPSVILPSVDSLDPLEELKKPKRRQPRPGTTAKDIKDKKKRRLEQNRLSARESRKKKKTYIESLEAEVNRLKTELAQCKQKLSENISIPSTNPNNIQPVMGSSDSILKMKGEIKEMTDKFIFACSQDTQTAETALQSLLMRYGIQSDERRRIVETLIHKVTENILPESYLYLIWAAKHDSGLFNPENICIDGLIKPKINVEEENSIEKICLSVKPDECEQVLITKSKRDLIEAGDQLKSKIHKFIEAKNDLYEEAKKLHTYINENLITKLSVNLIGSFLNWLQLNNSRQEFKANSVFELKKEHFGGHDLSIQQISPILTINKEMIRMKKKGKKSESENEEKMLLERPNIFIK